MLICTLSDIVCCSCSTGYEFDVDAENCADIDECAENNGGCANECHNTVGSFHCHCPPGECVSTGWSSVPKVILTSVTVQWEASTVTVHLVSVCPQDGRCPQSYTDKCHSTVGSFHGHCPPGECVSTGWSSVPKVILTSVTVQ